MTKVAVQHKRTARVYINEVRVRRIGNGHDFCSTLKSARPTRRRVLAMEASSRAERFVEQQIVQKALFT